MGLKKGTTNNPKGRPKGVRNKITIDVREAFKNLLESNIKQVEKDIKDLSPKERINILLKVSEFILPKLRSVEVEGKFSEESYREYLRLKTEHDRIANMTEEELDEELRKLQ